MALASFPPSFIIQSQAPSSRRSQVPGGRIRGGSADELHRTVPSPRQTNQGVWSGRFGLGSGRGSFLQTSFGRQKQTQGEPKVHYLTHHPHRGHGGFWRHPSASFKLVRACDDDGPPHPVQTSPHSHQSQAPRLGLNRILPLGQA